MSTETHAPLAPPPPPGWRAEHATHRAESWVQTTLVLVVTALLFYVMAIPKARRTLAQIEMERETIELQLALAELRTTIAEYRDENGFYPGWPPGTQRGAGDARATQEWFERHVADMLAEASHGAPASLRQVPANPVNGLASVQMLGPRQPWPHEPDGSTGWTYSARTGEIRANCAGNVFSSQRRFWDL